MGQDLDEEPAAEWRKWPDVNRRLRIMRKDTEQNRRTTWEGVEKAEHANVRGEGKAKEGGEEECVL